MFLQYCKMANTRIWKKMLCLLIDDEILPDLCIHFWMFSSPNFGLFWTFLIRERLCNFSNTSLIFCHIWFVWLGYVYLQIIMKCSIISMLYHIKVKDHWLEQNLVYTLTVCMVEDDSYTNFKHTSRYLIFFISFLLLNIQCLMFGVGGRAQGHGQRCGVFRQGSDDWGFSHVKNQHETLETE